MKKTALLIITILSISSWAARCATIERYVSVSGSDANPGTFARPYATIEKAKQAIRGIKKPRNGSVRVYIRGGEYFIDKPLIFGPEDGGTAKCPIIYSAYNDEKVVISGGMVLPSKWQKKEVKEQKETTGSLEKAVWTIAVPKARNKQWIFRQLFADGKRMPRAATPLYYTAGPLKKYAPLIKKYDFAMAGKLRQDNLEAFCTFRYNNNDLQNWNDLNGAEMIVYHSWECSWHTIHKVDEATNSVYLKSPGRYPIGFFGDKARYRVENIREALDDFGEWYLDVDKGELSYFAYPKEDPNTMKFVIPVAEQLLLIKGDAEKKQPVEHLSFTGIKFQHAAYPLGIHALSNEIKAKASKQYPWIDFNTGYTDSQAAPSSGEAISLYAANNCKFINCEFSHIGNYAIKIGPYSHHNLIENCELFDLGGGGLMIGFDERTPVDKGLPFSMSPSGNRVHNNFIYNGGRVHPSAVAVSVMQANNSGISHNEIYNFPYTGISCGWTWGSSANFTKGNIIEYNHIHHVMNDLDDGGGIYTLGIQQGAVIRSNYIHDIYRTRGAIGSFNNGIFFDEGSAGIKVENNLIRTIANQYIRFNSTDSTKMIWGKNYFGADITDRAFPAGIVTRAGHIYDK